MSEPVTLTDAVADVLWDHRELDMVPNGYECYCGQRVSEGYAIAPSLDAWVKHQAAAAVAAVESVVRQRMADAWDEGHHAGVMNATVQYDDNGQMVEPVGWRDNPHRGEGKP